MSPTPSRIIIPQPPKRRLRVFALDPILSQRIETHAVNIVTIKLPWEKNLKPGPVDDYLEVVDVDPASQAFYPPVDLNEHFLLAQDGLPPSEGNPQFHQQMTYAVARTTISHFELALGRRALWSPRLVETENGLENQFVERMKSTRMLCVKPMPTTPRPKKPFCLAIFQPPPATLAKTCPAGWYSPACRTISSHTRPRMP